MTLTQERRSYSFCLIMFNVVMALSLLSNRLTKHTVLNGTAPFVRIFRPSRFFTKNVVITKKQKHGIFAIEFRFLSGLL